jgi:anti-anti-sigma regulatory factor
MLADLRKKTSGVPLETVSIDFSDVRSVSYSFIDEFIGELVQSGGTATPRCVNVPAAAARTIERSLRRRGLDVERVLADALTPG